MSDYKKVAKDLRKEVSKITLSQQKQLTDIYTQSIDNIASQIRSDKAGSLKSKWQKKMVKSLKAERAKLVEEIEVSIRSGISDAAKVTTRSQFKLLEDMADKADMTVSKNFSDMYTSVNTNVINDILSGNLYKDSKTLSNRIWNYGAGFENDVQSVISQGILQKKSAVNLAKDLEKFVKDPSKRGKAWGDDYPSLKGKKVEYNAMRLARTSINHSYQTATIQSSQINPFVLGIEWSSALIHGRTCEICRERHGTIYPKDDVPLDHPNGLCAMIPATKSITEATDDLLDWLNGGKNSALDDAFDKVRAQEGILAPSAKLTKKSSITNNIVNGKNLVGKSKYDPQISEFQFDIEDIIHKQGYDGLPQILDEEDFAIAMEKSNFYAKRAYCAESQELLDEYRDQLYEGKFYVDASTGGAQYGQGMYVASTDDIANLARMEGVADEVDYYLDLGYLDRGFDYGRTEAMTVHPDTKFFTLPEGANAKTYVRHKYNMEYYQTYGTPTEIKLAEKADAAFNEWHEIIAKKDFKKVPAARKKYDKWDYQLDQSEVGKQLTDSMRIYDETGGIAGYKNEGTLVAEMGYDAIHAPGHGESGAYSVILNRTKLIIKRVESEASNLIAGE